MTLPAVLAHMVRDNRDRYGYRHRRDSDYSVGESMPGDVGDSTGTFHDRALQDANVIVDGEVRSMESYRRPSAESGEKKSRTKKQKSNTSNKMHSAGSISQADAVGKVVEVKIKSRGGTQDTIAQYKNHQVHVEGGSPGETVRIKLEKGKGFLVGEQVRVSE